jgi:hypothetical protein
MDWTVFILIPFSLSSFVPFVDPLSKLGNPLHHHTLARAPVCVYPVDRERNNKNQKKQTTKNLLVN